MAHFSWPMIWTRNSRLFILALLMFGWLVCTASATERETLSLQENAENWPITLISVNGQTTTALLDTGATIAMIDDDLFASDAIDSSMPETRLLGIGGQRLVPVTRISSLKAGTQAWYGLRVAVNTEDEFPLQQNILPTSIFQSDVVDFDFPNGRVELYDGRPQRIRGTHRNAIEYLPHEGLILIDIRINGAPGKALIDTGASVSFLNPHFIDRAGGVRRIEDEQDLFGSDLERNPVKIYRFRDLRFGSHRVSQFDIPVLETEMFAELGLGDEPVMVVGMDLLEHFRVQIDQKRQVLVLVR